MCGFTVVWLAISSLDKLMMALNKYWDCGMYRLSGDFEIDKHAIVKTNLAIPV